MSKATAPDAGRPAAEASFLGGNRWQRLQAFRKRHERAELALFFMLGFLFDVVTLGRIDDPLTLAQQAVYLGVLGLLVAADQRSRYLDREPALGRWSRLWKYREDIQHFLFGSLLSTSTLFFFKSASGITALLFLAAMFLVLLANEFPRFRRLGPVLRLGIFAFCLTAYFAYLIPVVAGFLSPWLFVAAVIAAGGPSLYLYRRIEEWSGKDGTALRRAALPMASVQALLLLLYFVGAIPPVPMSVQRMGIYHSVERIEGRYRLAHQHRKWQFWQDGDQTFRARPGDRVFVFAQIFAPRRFEAQVFVRFSRHDPKTGWIETDRIPLAIAGGREEGFRGFAAKENYQPGKWRVAVETEDGRTVGTLRFTVIADASSAPRVFQFDER